MKAVVYHGRGDVRVEEVPDPRIETPRDAIVKVTSTAICGSDLHLYDGYIPEMHTGDILGHAFMGEVVEVGYGNSKRWRWMMRRACTRPSRKRKTAASRSS